MPTEKIYRTSDLAREVGIHPNTVRKYVDWGLIPPVERSPSGYRRFTQKHIDCLRLARLIYGTEYSGKAIRHSGWQIIQLAVAGDWGGAWEKAYQHTALVQAEQAHANAAADLLERWASGTTSDPTIKNLRIGDAAKLLGVSNDVLRNWERNGLISIPRDQSNGYRQFSPEEISRLRVIRMLVKTGYSLMAILRMLNKMDRGEISGLRETLDQPDPQEDVFLASDHWTTTLTHEAEKGQKIIDMIEEIMSRNSIKNKS